MASLPSGRHIAKIPSVRVYHQNHVPIILLGTFHIPSIARETCVALFSFENLTISTLSKLRSLFLSVFPPKYVKDSVQVELCFLLLISSHPLLATKDTCATSMALGKSPRLTNC